MTSVSFGTSEQTQRAQPRPPRRKKRCSILNVAKAIILGIGLLGAGYNLYSTNNLPKSSNDIREATHLARDVASRLGAADPSKYAVYRIPAVYRFPGILAGTLGDGDIYIGREFEMAINQAPQANYTREEVEGALGHEIGHNELAHHDTIDLLQENITSQESWQSAKRELEREADLFTLKNPVIAYGLLCVYLRQAASSIGSKAHYLTHLTKSTHPCLAERVRYLIKGICERAKNSFPEVCRVPFSKLI